MKITYIELIGFTRMVTNHARVFKMDITAKTQLILGTNGSGKSSLMSELTPLPAEKNDYDKGGSKTIEIEHRNAHYRLVSDFAQGQRHSFFKNDIELNEGHTVTVQKELVKQEFGITPEIHDLLTGVIKFHEMTGAQRREWFTMLTPITYEYALSVYRKLKDRHRDVDGAIKRTKARLVVESSKIVSEEEQQRLEKEVKEMHQELDYLFELRKPIENSSQDLEAKFKAQMHQLNELNLKAMKQPLTVPKNAPHFNSVEEIEAHLELQKEKISGHEAVLNKAYQEHKKLKESQAVLKEAGEKGIHALDQKVRDLRHTRDKLLKRRKVALDWSVHPSVALESFHSVRETLTDIFTRIPENEDKRFSKLKLASLIQTLDSAKLRHAELVKEDLKIQAKKEHMEQHRKTGEVSCPRCGNGFIPGFDEVMYKSMDLAITNVQGWLKEQRRLVDDLQNQKDEFTAYGDLYRQFLTCVRSWPSLSPLWMYLEQEETVIKAPRMAASMLAFVEHDLQLDKEAAEIDKEIEHTQALIEKAASIGESTLAKTENDLQEKEIEIETLTRMLAILREEQRDYVQYRRQLMDTFTMSNRIEASITLIEALTYQQIETLRREMFNQVVRQLQMSLAKKEETLESVQRQRHLVVDLEKTIEQMQVEEIAAKHLVNIMSPTDGLIAEGLLSFIKIFVQKMNHLIRQIWSYPLIIQPCGITTENGAQLDYKFPMLVHTQEKSVKDVALGSTGMQEIVDLGFKITAMHYLGLEASPLYLDEFGKSFDDAHRVSASACIKALMDQKEFTQLFMVSHYKASYGVFTQAEICVLDVANIQVAQDMQYNQHVVFQ